MLNKNPKLQNFYWFYLSFWETERKSTTDSGSEARWGFVFLLILILHLLQSIRETAGLVMYIWFGRWDESWNELKNQENKSSFILLKIFTVTLTEHPQYCTAAGAVTRSWFRFIDWFIYLAHVFIFCPLDWVIWFFWVFPLYFSSLKKLFVLCVDIYFSRCALQSQNYFHLVNKPVLFLSGDIFLCQGLYLAQPWFRVTLVHLKHTHLGHSWVNIYSFSWTHATYQRFSTLTILAA